MSERKYHLATPIAIDGAINAGSTVIYVGSSAVQLLSVNSTRRIAYLSNHTGGSNSVYLGLDDSVNTGATTYFRPLNVGDTFKLENYSGDLYAIGGNSGYFAYIGVMEPYQ